VSSADHSATCDELTLRSIIGLSDGLTVPFALTAGLSSIGSSRLVVLGGLAELIAGAISMGLGGYRECREECITDETVASQAEMDHFHYLRRQTHARVARSCSGEMEREVHGILGPVGVDESLSRLVAESLREVEEDMCRDVGEGEEWDTAANGDQGVVRPGVGAGTGKRSDSAQQGILSSFGWSNKSNKSQEEETGGLKWSEDVGLTAFLLKFGEGMGELSSKAMNEKANSNQRKFHVPASTFRPSLSVSPTSLAVSSPSYPTSSSQQPQPV
jgi:hypothetical protein